MGAIRAKSGPNPSGNAILGSDQGEKWPKPERERDPRAGDGFPRGPVAEASCQFFSIDIRKTRKING